LDAIAVETLSRRPDDSREYDHLPALRPRGRRDHAARRLPVLLRLPRVRRTLEAAAGRLLRLLLLRLGPLPAEASGRMRLPGRLKRPPKTPISKACFQDLPPPANASIRSPAARDRFVPTLYICRAYRTAEGRAHRLEAQDVALSRRKQG